jgi:DNA-directed RNA polymerase specialized sigma24 family protein
VYTVIRRCGLNGYDADDLFHRVWLTAWERLGTLGDERRLERWLVTLAVQEVRRSLTRRSPTSS